MLSIKKNLFLLSLILVFICGKPLFAQNDIDAVALADEMYNYGDKKDALDVYLQALQFNPNNVRANYMIGICYLETTNKEKSVTYFLKSLSIYPKYNDEIYFNIGRGYHFGNDFDKAITYYNKYIEYLRNQTDKYKNKEEIPRSVLIQKTEKKIIECQNAKNAFLAPINIRMKLLGEEINTSYPDYSPAITPDEKIMIFTSRRQGSTGKKKDKDNEFFEDIYMSKFEDGAWGYAKNLGIPINSEFHDGSIGISADAKTIFLYHSSNGGDIFSSIKQPDGTWSVPEPMKGKINSKGNEPSVFFCTDGKTLYFSSDRKGGFGGLDIYKCILDSKGEWSEPVNLGKEINTPFEDDCPYFEAKDSTLYFSSNGHKNIGGYDIYKTKIKRGTWSLPENLGYPINTTDDDIYFAISGDGKHGYYSSAKSDGYGEKDIYVLDLDPKEEKFDSSQITSRLVDKKKEASSSNINDNSSSQIIQSRNLPTTFKATTSPPTASNANSSNTNTQIVTEKPKETLTVQTSVKKEEKTKEIIKIIEEPKIQPVLVVTKENTTAKTEPKEVVEENQKAIIYSSSEKPDPNYKPALNPETIKSKTYNLNTLPKKRLAVGMRTILRNVYFDYDQSILKPESNIELDALQKFLKENPSVLIELGGHTDSIANDEYNISLSHRRAQSVSRYLINKNIDSSRLIPNGYGEKYPLATNDDEEEGRELNRRTEFIILKK